MSESVYSKINDIPKGSASDKITEGCLVLEGGAFRGMYTMGMLDAFMQNDLNFRCTIGCSAGALAGMNYVAGMIGRSARANLTYRHDSDFIGVGSVRKAHSVIRLDFLLKDLNAIELLNVRRLFDPQRRYVVVATNCDTGKAMYFDRDYCGNIFDAAKASASMPYVTPMVNVDGIPCLDGGAACKIPYQWAIDQGYEKIVLIKTRENGFRKKVSDRKVAQRIYRNHQAFAISLDNSSANYNKQCDEIEQLQAKGRMFVIAPSQKVTVTRVEGDVEKLGDLYWLGYNDALNNLDALREYLNK
ncbi:MAG: patatin family protein [Erysipelotrichaceae bacterium]|nr:patatin family protein [Erysipelotrichaceae bacterium]